MEWLSNQKHHPHKPADLNLIPKPEQKKPENSVTYQSFQQPYGRWEAETGVTKKSPGLEHTAQWQNQENKVEDQSQLLGFMLRQPTICAH